MRARKLIAAAAAIPLVVATMGVAHADTVENMIDASAADRVTVAQNVATTVSYRVKSESQDGNNGCNASTGNPIRLDLNVPADVSAAGDSLAAGDVLTFTQCGTHQNVTFQSAKAGTYAITGTHSGGVGTTTNDSNWTLIVTAADTTAPVITPTVTGTLGQNGWYTSDVSVTWSVTDAQSTISSRSGCDAVSITADQASVTYTCTATSAGGTNTQSVSVNRDATDPVISGTDVINTTWRNTPLSESFTASDGMSGLAVAADEAFTLSATQESGGASSPTTDSKVVADAAGNTATRSLSALIDLTPPVVTPDNVVNADWRNTSFSQAFTASDDLSGLQTAGDASFTLSASAQSSAGTPTTDSKVVRDAAGNEVTRTLSALIDTTAPEISGADVHETAWRNTPLRRDFTASDALSGLANAAADSSFTLTASAESANGSTPTADSRTVVDRAGNSSTRAISALIDMTAPEVTGPNVVNTVWRNTDLSERFSASDPLSGLQAAADASFTLTATLESAGANTPTYVERDVVDVAGNVTTRSVSAFIDKTDPVISGSDVVDTTWRNTPLSHSFTASDALSGLATGDDRSFSLEVSDESVNATTPVAARRLVTDRAGNTASRVVSAFIDKTSPTVQLVGGPAAGASYYFGSVPAAPTCSAFDGLSGLVAACSVTSSGGSTGTRTYTATVTDRAGNVGTAQVSYTVLAWTTRGFHAPVDLAGVWNTVKGGSTVPLKFEAFAAEELTSTGVVESFVATAVQCPNSSAAVDPIETVVTGGTALRYDGMAGQFIQNWQTPKKPGTCATATITLKDGSPISANFSFK